MAIEVNLPRFVSSRDAARNLLTAAGDLTGETVVLNARNLRSASPSSVDELVLQVLVISCAEHLEVVSATSGFVQDVDEAAEEHDVKSRVRHAAVS